MDGLAAIQLYAGQHDAARGRAISSAILDFAYDIVGPFPQAYPTYAVPEQPEREYRRAIFRREYALLYEVTAAEVSFLLVYSIRQNPGSMVLPG